MYWYMLILDRLLRRAINDHEINIIRQLGDIIDVIFNVWGKERSILRDKGVQIIWTLLDNSVINRDEFNEIYNHFKTSFHNLI